MNASDVQRYYEANTDAFLRFGQGGAHGVIHRVVWGPGTSSETEAFHYVERRLCERLTELAKTHPKPRVLDLGAGVGASLIYLAQRTPVQGIGVTLSARQAALGQARIAAAGLSQRLEMRQHDFNDLEGLPRVHLAYAIEAFVHASDPQRFFEQAASRLQHGGELLLCDDFEADHIAGPSALTRGERRWLDELRRGWVLNSLMGTGRADDLARSAGLELVDDERLTGYLQLGRPRDRAIRALVALGRPLPLSHPRWLNLVGGNALQHCLRTGLVDYRLRRYRKH